MVRAGDRIGRQQPRPPCVRDQPETFLQYEARLRIEAVGAAARGSMSQLEVIGSRVVTAQTQFESTPAAGYAVTCARVAAGDVQGRDELLAEADRLRLVEKSVTMTGTRECRAFVPA